LEIVELGRAYEILVARWLMEPCALWAAQRGLPAPGGLNMLGQVRSALALARDIHAGVSANSGPSRSLADYVVARNFESYCLGDLVEHLGFVNDLRRKAAHKDMITGLDATQFRERFLGIGSGTPILARLVDTLGVN